MIGDKLKTKYFGVYEEQKDTDNPAVEIVGNVVVRKHGENIGAYFYEEGPLNTRYDLPKFMTQFDGKTVAVLARKFNKHVEGKVFRKLVVISARVISKQY